MKAVKSQLALIFYWNQPVISARVYKELLYVQINTIMNFAL